jgi:hypothetical protein
MQDVAAKYNNPAFLERVMHTVEKYNDSSFIDQLRQRIEKYQTPDFVHSVLHPRATAAEWTEQFNKMELYDLSSLSESFDGDKRIVLTVGDLLGITAQIAKQYLDYRSVRAMLTFITHNMSIIVNKHAEQLLPLLEQDQYEQVLSLLLDAFWQEHTVDLLGLFLAQRLIHACLLYAKSAVTPLPFYLHGKTSAGQAADEAVRDSLSLLSVVPIEWLAEGFDPALHSHAFIGNAGFSWQAMTKYFAAVSFELGSHYLLEAAKQFDMASSIDEQFLFFVVREMGSSTWFIYRCMRPLLKNMLLNCIQKHEKKITKLLTARLAAPTALDQVQNEAEVQRLLGAYFNRYEYDCVRALRMVQYQHNAVINTVLLMPAAYKVGSVIWDIVRSTQKEAQA